MKKTTTEQFIDDLISSGVPLGNELKKYFQENKNKLKEVNEKFYNHIYPQHKLNWNKTYIDNLELCKLINSKSFGIFNAISKLTNKNNLIQISNTEIINITGYSKQTIINCINELIEKGLITIKLKGETKTSRATIYMINPELITIGTGKREQLKKEFWKITGSIYKNGILKEMSNVHKKWIDFQENQAYIIGYDKIQIDNEIIYFNKLSKKEKSSINFGEHTDEITF